MAQSRVSEFKQSEGGGSVGEWMAADMGDGLYTKALIKSINILLMKAKFLIVKKRQLQRGGKLE